MAIPISNCLECFDTHFETRLYWRRTGELLDNVNERLDTVLNFDLGMRQSETHLRCFEDKRYTNSPRRKCHFLEVNCFFERRC